MNEERHLTLEDMMTYLDAELTPSDATRCREHLLNCDKCARAFEYLKATVNKLVALPEAPVTAGLADSILKQANGVARPADGSGVGLPGERSRRIPRQFRDWLPLALAAGLLVVIAAVWMASTRSTEMNIAGVKSDESQMDTHNTGVNLTVDASEIPPATDVHAIEETNQDDEEDTQVVWAHTVASATTQSATDWKRQFVYSGFSRLGDQFTAQMLDLDTMQTFRTVSGASIGAATVVEIHENSILIELGQERLRVPLLAGNEAERIFSQNVALEESGQASSDDQFSHLVDAKDGEMLGIFLLRRQATVRRVPDTLQIGAFQAKTPRAAMELDGHFISAAQLANQAQFLKTWHAPSVIPRDVFPVFAEVEGKDTPLDEIQKDGVYLYAEPVVALQGDKVGPFKVEKLTSESATMSYGRYRFELKRGAAEEGELGLKGKSAVLVDMSQWQVDTITPDMEAELKKNKIQADTARAKAEMRNLAVALETYYIDHATYPPPADEYGQPVEPGDEEGLVAGFIPNNLTTPIQYLSAIPQDPFAQEKDRDSYRGRYRYSTHPDSSWLTLSIGPDGRLQTDMLEYVETPDITLTDPDAPRPLSHVFSMPSSFPRAFDWMYDPSNGVDSKGDIYRTGP